MLTLKKAADRIGHPVIYHGGQEKEDGVIWSVNEEYIFVRFYKQGFITGVILNQLEPTSKACQERDLTLSKEWDEKSRWRNILNES